MLFRAILTSLVCQKWSRSKSSKDTSGQTHPLELHSNAVQVTQTSRSTSQREGKSETCIANVQQGLDRDHKVVAISKRETPNSSTSAIALPSATTYKDDISRTMNPGIFDHTSSQQPDQDFVSSETLIDAEPRISACPQSSLQVENPSLSELDLSISEADEASRILKLLEKRLGKQKKMVWTPESSVTQLDDHGGIQCGSILSFQYNEKDFDCAGDALEGPSTRRTVYLMS